MREQHLPPLERVLAALSNVRETGSRQWDARCPSHDDRKNSLSISVADDGRVLLFCHAGCEKPEIVESLGWTMADLFPQRNDAVPRSNGKSRIVATYDYRDEQGKLLFQVCRLMPKDFRQRRPDDKGGWKWTTKGVRKVLYELPELLKADASQPVFVVEGEKDVERLRSLGLVATCNAGGAGKWKPEYAKSLRGRHIVIIPDNDDAGRKHAQGAACNLEGVAESVKTVELPGLPDKGDVSDWLNAGGTSDVLHDLTDQAPEWQPSSPTGPVLRCLADIEARPINWLWPRRIPAGRITLLVGRPGEGKSFLTCDLAARISTGTPWPDGSTCSRGSVLLVTAEDDPSDTIRPRLDAHHADVRRVHILTAVRHADENGDVTEVMFTLRDVAALEAALKTLPDCRLIVIDPIGSFLGGGTDAHRDNEVRSVLAPVAQLAEKYGVAVLVVAHVRKTLAAYADDMALGSRAFTGIARAVWHLTHDREHKLRRLLLPGKCNLAAQQTGLAFTIGGDPPSLCWEREPVDLTADDRVAEDLRPKRGPDPEAQNEAQVFLRQALADGPRLVKDIRSEALDAHGIGKRTLDRAKKSIGVVAYRPEIPGPWW
ncbi:MAG: AAA family ATPase, partial [Planctomycetaceae bacterium]